jgi:hypothetical protein
VIIPIKFENPKSGTPNPVPLKHLQSPSSSDPAGSVTVTSNFLKPPHPTFIISEYKLFKILSQFM